MEKSYCIYMHINVHNHKVYIGQTCLNPNDRWRKGRGYKHCPRFYEAIQKHGWDAFDHLILHEGLTKEQADSYEQYYIERYNSGNEQYGYNCRGSGHYTAQPNKVHGKSKAVICLETGRIFQNLSDATAWCGLKSTSSISIACTGKRQSAGKHPITGEKLHWKFVEKS